MYGRSLKPQVASLTHHSSIALGWRHQTLRQRAAIIVAMSLQLSKAVALRVEACSPSGSTLVSIVITNS